MYTFQREQDQYREREQQWQRRRRWPIAFSILANVRAVTAAFGLLFVSILLMLGLFLVPIAISAAKTVWDTLDAGGYIYHDKMTRVFGADDWQLGEYRSCETQNSNDQPTILCGGKEVFYFFEGMPHHFARYAPNGVEAATDSKLFMVRFWGKTYDEKMPHIGSPSIGSSPDGTATLSILSYWDCRKNESADPSITCHQTKQPNP
jgi:hypothetical protein